MGLFIIFLMLVAGIAYYFWINEQKKQKSQQFNQQSMIKEEILMPQSESNISENKANQNLMPESQSQSDVSKNNAEHNQNAEYWFNQGVELVDSGDDITTQEEGIIAFKKAIEIEPNYAIAWYMIGFALRKLERYEEAIISFYKSVEIEPDNFYCWYFLGEILNDLGRYEEAIICSEKAIDIDSDNDQYLSLAWSNRGISFAKLRKDEESMQSFDKAIVIDPNNESALKIRDVMMDGFILNHLNSKSQSQINFDKCYDRGYELAQAGEHQKAIFCYDEAIELNSDHSGVWCSRGIALGRLGRDEEAICSYDKAIELQPNYAMAWYKRGFALQKLERYEEAIISYYKSVEIEPDNFYCWYLLGEILDDLGRYEEAIICSEKAIDIGSDDDEYLSLAWSNRGISFVGLRKIKEAMQSFNKAIEIDPNNDKALKVRDMMIANSNIEE